MSSAAIVFADLAGFTALTEAHGDLDAASVARRFLALAESALVADATVVKTIGDAVMIRAADGAAAVASAVELLHAVDLEDRFPRVRIGVNEGEVVEQEGDYFGTTVNVAARLAAHAAPGQALVVAPLAGHVAGHEGVRTHALGDLRLKNVRDPVAVVAIEHVRHRTTVEVLDPVCRMLIDADDAPARLPWAERTWFFCSIDCATRFLEQPAAYVG